MRLHRIATLWLTGLLASVPAGAQARQAPATLSHELLWSFQRVGAPVPSPDGKWVVFSVFEPSYDPLKDVTDLWVVPADGSGAPRRLTASKGTESGPAWSPDSARIAFAAKRDDDEVNQIYVLDVVRGGEAQLVTAAATAASVPRWSPDGQKILFQAVMWPGATDEETNRKAVQERKNTKSKVRIYDSFPIKNFDHWIEESKSHLWVVDVPGDRQARSLFGRSQAAAMRGFGGDALGAVWSPDGQSVVFVATENDGELMMGGLYWENPATWIAQSPLAKAGNFKTPTLLSVGLNDFRVPEGNTLTMYAALQRMRVPTRLLIWPDENHWILKGENSRVFYREVRSWLEKYLLPVSPPTAVAGR